MAPNPLLKKIRGLYAVIDTTYLRPDEIEGTASKLLLAGVKVLQLRAKDWGGAGMLAAGKALRALTSKHKAVFIMNDRVDIALLADADGVHLGQDDLPLKDARELTGPSKIIGISTHNEEEAKRAEDLGAGYISFGPVFPTRTKKDAQAPRGLEALAMVREKVSLPIVAIGGITEENIASVIAAGADSAAVISDILLSKDILSKTSSIMSRIRPRGLDSKSFMG